MLNQHSIGFNEMPLATHACDASLDNLNEKYALPSFFDIQISEEMLEHIADDYDSYRLEVSIQLKPSAELSITSVEDLK